MADMATILGRQGQRGGVDERTLFMMALLQGLGEVGKTATGIADWAMRSRESARAEERHAYEKKRRPFEEGMADLQQARAQLMYEQAQKEADEWNKAAPIRAMQQEDMLAELKRKAAERAATSPIPESRAAKMAAVVDTIAAETEATLATNMAKGMPQDMTSAFFQNQSTLVALVSKYAQEIKAETADLPPEERDAARLRMGQEAFGAISNHPDIYFPSIVGSARRWSDVGDTMNKEGTQDIDSPEGKAALAQLWEEDVVSAGVLSGMFNKEGTVNRPVWNRAQAALLTDMGTSRTAQNQVKIWARGKPKEFLREITLMGYRPTGEGLAGKDLAGEADRTLQALMSAIPEYDYKTARGSMRTLNETAAYERGLLDQHIQRAIGDTAMKLMETQPMKVEPPPGAYQPSGGVLEPMRRTLSGQPPGPPQQGETMWEALQRASIYKPGPWQPPPKWAEGLQPWQ